MGFWRRIIVAYALIVALLVWREHFSLPPAKDASCDPSEFSEGRALQHLKQLSVDIGERLVGQPAEQRTVDYLVNAFASIKDQLEQQENPAYKLEISVQNASSGHYFYPRAGSVAYSGIRNVVARLVPLNRMVEGEDEAILMGAHFDTAISSPGASDDGLAVVSILEIFRALIAADPAKHPPLRRTVIANLNGAEEVGLIGAHAFITQHMWNTSIKAFINLEAIGAGGPEALFQTGPHNSWLAEAFARSAPYPRGTVVAQDIFQSGAIPGDTDFRVYRDFGSIPGLDFAFYHKSYVYHSRLDNMKQIDKGSVQHMGSNTLALIRYLGSYPHRLPSPSAAATSSPPQSPLQESVAKKAVYYDIQGFVMIYYSDQFATALHAIALSTALFALLRMPSGKYGIRRYMIKVLAPHVALTLMCWVCAVVFAGLLAFVMKIVLRHPMSWHHSGNIALALLLYVPPALLGLTFGAWNAAPILQLYYRCIGYATVTATATASSDSGAQPFDIIVNTCGSVLAIWAGLLAAGTYKNLGSAYLALYYVVALSLGLMYLQQQKQKQQKRGSFPLWLIALLLAPTVLTLDVSQMFLELFIPLMARQPSDVIEIKFSCLIAIMSVISTSTVFPFMVYSFTSKGAAASSTQTRSGSIPAWRVFAILVLLSALGTSVAMRTFPFSDRAPKRVLFTHNNLYKQHFHLPSTTSTATPTTTGNNAPASYFTMAPPNPIGEEAMTSLIRVNSQNVTINSTAYFSWDEESFPALVPTVIARRSKGIYVHKDANTAAHPYNTRVSLLKNTVNPATGIRTVQIKIQDDTAAYDVRSYSSEVRLFGLNMTNLHNWYVQHYDATNGLTHRMYLNKTIKDDCVAQDKHCFRVLLFRGGASVPSKEKEQREYWVLTVEFAKGLAEAEAASAPTTTTTTTTSGVTVDVTSSFPVMTDGLENLLDVSNLPSWCTPIIAAVSQTELRFDY